MRDLSINEIKEINKLYLAKYRKEFQKFIVEGSHLVEEAKNAGVLIEAFSINNPNYTIISEQSMKKICKTDTIVNTIGICRLLPKKELSNHLLLLDAIQDPGNLGTLMRSAKAFGFETIVLGKGTVDIYNDKVIRSSQGAIFKLNFINADLEEFIKTNTKYTYYGTDVKTGVEVEKVAKTELLGLILGNEGNGMNEKLKTITKSNIYIPLNNTESLNVSVAGGILMYLLK